MPHQVMPPAMNNKSPLVEVQFLAYAVVMATAAFTLMIGSAIWQRIAGKPPEKSSI